MTTREVRGAHAQPYFRRLPSGSLQVRFRGEKCTTKSEIEAQAWLALQKWAVSVTGRPIENLDLQPLLAGDQQRGRTDLPPSVPVAKEDADPTLDELAQRWLEGRADLALATHPLARGNSLTSASTVARDVTLLINTVGLSVKLPRSLIRTELQEEEIPS